VTGVRRRPIPFARSRERARFFLGLRGGREAEGDLVKAQGQAQLSIGIGLAGEEKGVVVDIESRGQAS
jgi:hypothetical protein